MINLKLSIAAASLVGAALTFVPADASACAPYGLIGAKWTELKSTLGNCVDDEYDDGAGGRIEQFQGGYVDWVQGQTQAFAVSGVIGNAWITRYGGPAVTGHPTSDEFTICDQWGYCGRMNTFGYGSESHQSLVWNPGDGGETCNAHSDNVCQVYGLINQDWDESETAGMPVDEAFTSGNHVYQWFQGMYFTFNQSNGAVCGYNNPEGFLMWQFGGPC
ncbi:MAG TPA: hypothetical protein VGG28_29205 [Kofleriaceae bacterium]|jgi:hypothetical protein